MANETITDELKRTKRERDKAAQRVETRKEKLAKERQDVKQARQGLQRERRQVQNIRQQLQTARQKGQTKRVKNLQAKLEKNLNERTAARQKLQRERSQVAPARTALQSARQDLGIARANYQSAQERRREAKDYIRELEANNPWLRAIGLDPTWLQNVVAGASTPAEVVAKIRQTPQYRKRFVGILRDDGTMRMTEADYIRTEDAYRQLLRQYGFEGYNRPEHLVGFFQQGIDPNELRDRLEVYRGIQTGGQAIKDAFYVYAGMNITDDDLLAAVVDPAAAQRLTDSYNQKVAQGKFDYATWIARASAAGMGRVVNKLKQLQAQGAVTATAVQAIMSIRPEFAQQIMSAIYRGAGDDTRTLSLTEALEAFEFAAIGAAARGAGLEMPTLERLREIRARGVERARAIEAYTAFGKNAAQFNAAVQRARGRAFGQEQFERASFLGDAALQREFELSLAQERAAGERVGTFRFAEDQTGRIVQRGLAPRR